MINVVGPSNVDSTRLGVAWLTYPQILRTRGEALLEQPGRRTRSGRAPDGAHQITITTPTGHTYVSTAPAAPLPAGARTETQIGSAA